MWLRFKATIAQLSKKAARKMIKAMVEKLRFMKLKETAKKEEDGMEKTLNYFDFSSKLRTRNRTNNSIERVNGEIYRHTCVVGSFPDGNFTLMLVYARLRHVAVTQWSNKNIKHTFEVDREFASIAG